MLLKIEQSLKYKFKINKILVETPGGENETNERVN